MRAVPVPAMASATAAVEPPASARADEERAKTAR